ncbi:hypothetical protein KZ876_31565, partial [Pseudomonas aeruginosa]|nr:hypothetical protein [Pseudomonas aeruginosa]
MAAKTKSPWSRRANNRFAVIRSPWLRRGRVEPAAQPALDTPRNGCHAGAPLSAAALRAATACLLYTSPSPRDA